MGCGASAVDKALSKTVNASDLKVKTEGLGTYEPVHNSPRHSKKKDEAQTKMDLIQKALLEDNNDDDKDKKTDEEEDDPILKTFQSMLPTLQQKKDMRKSQEVDLPGTPQSDHLVEKEEEEHIVEEVSENPAGKRAFCKTYFYSEAEALNAAKAVVKEITKQVEAGRQVANSPLYSPERKRQVSNDCDELEKLVPQIISATREAFGNPDGQTKLKAIISKIAQLNARIEENLKPENSQVLVLPKPKYQKEEDIAPHLSENEKQQLINSRPSSKGKNEIQTLKEEAKKRANELKTQKTNTGTAKPRKEEMLLEELEEDKTALPTAVPNIDEEWSKIENLKRKREEELRKTEAKAAPAKKDEDADKPWVQHKNKLVHKEKKYESGDKYTGTFNSKGQQHGYGRYEFNNRDVYEGEFVNGKFEGKGKFQAANGDRYEGMFKDDCYHGWGIFIDAENGDRYEGEFEMGERKGYGTYFYATGDKYEGEFRNGEKHGKGKFTSADGKTIYVGDYVQGKRHGRGIFIHKGNKYEGQFRNGKMQGHGALWYENGNHFVGEFQNGEIDGKGVFTFSNGVKYEGVVRKDQFEHGMMTFPNGDVYTGEFLARKIHGYGYMVYANGEIYEGEFADGRRHGKGCLTLPSGEVKEGQFINNRFVPPPSWGKVDKKPEVAEHQEEEDTHVVKSGW